MDLSQGEPVADSIPRRRAGRLRGIVAALLLSALVAPVGFALDPSLRLTQYVHDSWTSNEGLPQDSINDIAQTPDGYLWLATQEGIARFDGSQFMTFDSKSTGGTIQNFVYALFVDRRGTLWAGASGGLLRYDGKGSFNLVGPKQGWPDSSAKSLAQDGAGSLWAGLATDGGSHGRKGLVRLKDGRVTIFTTRDGLSSDEVHQTWPDGNDLWIATGNGLDVMTEGKVRVYTTADGLASNDVRAVRKDHAGNVWAGTARGLSRYRDGRFTTFTTTDGLLDNEIRSLYEDRDGVVWVATAKGVNRFVQGELQSAAGIPGLGDDRIFTFMEGREGSLWIGTHASGLHRLRSGKFTPYGSPEGLSGTSVSAMYEDRAGRMWLAMAGGALNVLANGALVTKDLVQDGFGGDTINTMLEDRAGNFWAGTDRGLKRLQQGRFGPPLTVGLPDVRVTVLYEDRVGTLWVGTSNGLARRVAGKVEPVPLPRGAPGSIRLLDEDREGRLWIGGGDGLGYLANGKYTAVPAYGANVQSMLEDPDGTLWFTTWGSGLLRLRARRMTRITSVDGLFDDVAWKMVDDGAGNFWMGSNRGVSRVSREELSSFAPGRGTAIHSVSYGVADGMRRREINLTQHSIIRAHDGTLWFATTDGVAVIDPIHIRTNRLPPPVILEHFSTDGNVMPTMGPLELPPGRGNLEVEYVALTFVAPSRVRYRYMLEGFDKEWIEAGTRRTAYYTNIAPGTYTFRVIAANDDGVWNTRGASLTFRLAPAFHQTWWFYVLIVVALMVLAGVINVLRKRQLAIRHQVFHDPLTGLANRTLLTARGEVALTQAARLGHSIAILFLDLDGFKSVNDTLGHAVGDRLLQLVASRFRSCIREVDTLARIGGDEFAALVADLADESRAAEVAQRLITAMQRDFSFDGHNLMLGVSIGIAVHPFDGSDVATMLQAADRAMYRAKLSGGNAYQFNSADAAETVTI